VGSVFTRLRARRDYARLLLRHHWAYLLSFLSLAVALISLVAESVAVAAGVLAAGLGLLLLVRDSRRLQQERDDVVATELDATAFDALVVPEALGHARHLSWAGDRMLIFGDVGEEFHERLAHVRFRYVDRRAALAPQFREVAPYALRHLMRAGKVLFDGPILALASDVPARGEEADALVVLRRAGFYDGLCSNELSRTVFRSHRQDRVLLDGRRLVMDAAHRLRSLADSYCTNGIGISTIALSADGRLLVVAQSMRNVAGGGKLAPAGSGSAEPRDLEGAADLREVIVRSMERELREECGLASNVPIDTKLLGWGRWVERGARPECFGVSLIPRRASALRIRPGERLFVAEQRELHAGRLELDLLLEAGDARFSADRSAFSLPLYVCLSLLQEALKSRSGMADWLAAGASA
jgi:hypothetical protein